MKSFFFQKKLYFKILDIYFILKFIRKPYSVICLRRGKVENYTLNPYILGNFTYNMEQSLDSEKGSK